MNYLTEDIDSILGGRFDLINIDISELRLLARSGQTDPSGYPPLVVTSEGATDQGLPEGR
ncbi:MAG TPA: hypothetical protein VEN79_16615 [Terriglobia bacterium]|nr:hypothetical protein [Terriglobia bacterium]